MRKITAIILVFFMTINISFAFQGDILYVKNNNSELKKSANDSSETLAKLMK